MSTPTKISLPDFADPELLDWLLEATEDDIERLPFGVVGMDQQLICTLYNEFESHKAGLPAERVVGRPFFEEIAPCMNNALVSDKLLEDSGRDETLAYTLSVRIKPTDVTLRLLARKGEAQKFLIIDWTGG